MGLWHHAASSDYSYTLGSDSSFDDYDIEQQAQIIQHYYNILSFDASGYGLLPTEPWRIDSSLLVLYESVIPFVN